MSFLTLREDAPWLQATQTFLGGCGRSTPHTKGDNGCPSEANEEAGCPT